jgi:hypothetical protein
VTVLFVSLICVAQLGRSYSTGGLTQGTGAPGEDPDNQCVKCHSDFPVGFGGGTLSINASDTFAPGQEYPISVTISRTGSRRWGFELAVVTPTGLPVGILSKDDTDSTIWINRDFQTGIAYMTHESIGTFEGEPGATWNMQWSAPDDTTTTSVIIYASGVAADGTNTRNNDFVYLTNKTLTRSTTPVQPRSWGAIKALFAAPRAHASFSATAPAPTRCPVVGR